MPEDRYNAVMDWIRPKSDQIRHDR